MKRSQSISSKVKITEENPKVLRKNVSSVMELRMSPLPPANDKYMFIPKHDDLRTTGYVKILKQKHQIQIEPISKLEGIDKISFERHYPGYKNNKSEYKQKYQNYVKSPKAASTPSVILKIEERRKKFFERYQKLFAQGNQPDADKIIQNVRSSLAEVRAPKGKAVSSNFYRVVRDMLEKVH